MFTGDQVLERAVLGIVHGIDLLSLDPVIIVFVHYVEVPSALGDRLVLHLGQHVCIDLV